MRIARILARHVDERGGFAAQPLEPGLHLVELAPRIMGTRDRRLDVQGLNDPYAINRAWFSPDGSAILFDLFEEDGDHWAIVPSDGGPVRRIGPEWPGDTPDASWSPDGRSVLALFPTEDGGNELWILDATGSEPDRRLVGEPAEHHVAHPA